MRFNIYRGRLLFHSTVCVDEAWRLFKVWTIAGHNCRVERIIEEAA